MAGDHDEYMRSWQESIIIAGLIAIVKSDYSSDDFPFSSKDRLRLVSAIRKTMQKGHAFHTDMIRLLRLNLETYSIIHDGRVQIILQIHFFSF
jgi:hypothetical protein